MVKDLSLDLLTASMLKRQPASLPISVGKKFPHPAVSAGHVKPIEIGGTRISTSVKSFDFTSEDSGGSLEMRVGPTAPQITNSAGKIHAFLSRTSRVAGSRSINNTPYYHVFT
jgi:hypothetical protein